MNMFVSLDIGVHGSSVCFEQELLVTVSRARGTPVAVGPTRMGPDPLKRGYTRLHATRIGGDGS